MSMKYTIQRVGTSTGWQYRVTIWSGRVAYIGQRTYKRHQDAERAAKATGATDRAAIKAVEEKA